MRINDIISELLEKKEGIWFGPSGGYWSNLDLEENRRYVKSLPESGARDTVRRYFPEHFDVIFSPKRAAGLLLLDPKPGETIVDNGCMWGALTLPLARARSNVIAIDQTIESLKLLKQRLIDERLDNVELLCLDLRRVNYKSSSVDKFVVSGVLEWIPESGVIELKKYYGKRRVTGGAGEKDPYVMQVNFLKNIYKGLKPGGTLYLSIENRYDIFHFLGLPDPHCNIRFITFLPRFLQDIVSKTFLVRPYVNWTYSERGLKKLLKTAGFGDIKISYAFPDYRSPDQILSKSGMKYYMPHKFRRAKNIFIKVACYAIEDIVFRRLKATVFAPSFVVLAKK